MPHSLYFSAAVAALRRHRRPLQQMQCCSWISSLKVPWKKDRTFDVALAGDKHYLMASRVVREVVLSPGRRLPLRYLEKRRPRLRLPIRISTFLSRYPNLLHSYPDRIRPSSPPIPFLRPSVALAAHLDHVAELHRTHADLNAAKIAKLLMMSEHRSLSVGKLFATKRLFGLPDDFLTTIVPAREDLFRFVGGDPDPNSPESFIELVRWDPALAKSDIEKRAEKESAMTGIRIRPNFTVNMPKGFFLKKEMREWAWDWLELPYVSPYESEGVAVSNPASREAEKRAVGVCHEVLCLTVEKRAPVPLIGKFAEEFRLSNAFANMFLRHPGIFYVSLKGGVQTAMLREAYQQGRLVMRDDPMVAVKDRFVELMDEGHREYLLMLKQKRENMEKYMETMARNSSGDEPEGDEEEEEEISQLLE